MRKIRYIIIMLLVGIALTSSFFICKEIMQNKKQEEIFEQLTKIAEEQVKDDVKEEKKEKQINLKSLYDINQDIVGWLKIENTNINYPIMKSKIKDYYLRRDFYKNYSSYGTPYIANNCDIGISDNIVIYGHHIQGNKMFGYLEQYKSKEFYEDNKIIKFYTMQENKTVKTGYEIFAVFKTIVYGRNSFKYYDFTNFNNELEYNSFFEKCKSLSLYETNIIPEYKEKIITLSTCEYSNRNGRLVVMAREIKN